MKSSSFLFLLILLNGFHLSAQENDTWTSAAELEELDESRDPDAVAQYRYECSRRPLNINQVTMQELLDLQILEDSQLQQFIAYRNLLGPFISIYELQSIPGWELPLLKRLQPYIAYYSNSVDDWSASLRVGEGTGSLWMRLGFNWPPADQRNNNWVGPNYSSQLRFRYLIGNKIDIGFVADKDAGEPFLSGKNRWGFDFYSGHFFLKGSGDIKAIALGDFIVNMGQGLLHWQGPAYRRSAGISGIKRQGEMLQSYRSAGEFHFNRGIGLNIKKGKWEGLLFYSSKPISSNQVLDSITNKPRVTSFSTGGYHRSEAELYDKNNLLFRSAGTTLRYKSGHGHVSLNVLFQSFSVPLRASSAPHERFEFNGSKAALVSLDHSMVWKNMHFFGEGGIDQERKIAAILGVMAALDRKLDILLLFKYAAPGFTSFSGNAYTENVLPENELGGCLGFEYRPNSRWVISGNLGQGQELWPGYRQVQLDVLQRIRGNILWSPDKKTNLNIGYQYSRSSFMDPSKALVNASIHSAPTENWQFLTRWDWCRTNNEDENGFGYSFLVETRFRKRSSPIGFALHSQFYDTDDYESRIYVSESGLRFSRSLFLATGKGLRNFLALTIAGIPKKYIKKIADINFSVKFTQTIDLNTQNTDFQVLIGKYFTVYSLQMQAICGF